MAAKNDKLPFSAKAMWQGALVPEQGAVFELTLENADSHPHEVPSLELVETTPIVRVFGPDGTPLVEAIPRDVSDHVAGHMGEPDNAPPIMVKLDPGEKASTVVDAWSYKGPLRPGKYSFEAEHVGPKPLPSVTDRISFDVARAKVESCVVAYESAARMASVMAWTAAQDGKDHEVFVRLSGFSNHTWPQYGGTSCGQVPPGTRIALSQIAPGGAGAWHGWVAVASGNQVDVIRHNNARIQWRTGTVDLPIQDALPVHRFPDRGHGVLLATGTLPNGAPALSGLAVRERAQIPAPWVVPLPFPVAQAACIFAPDGPISLLLIGDDGTTSTFARIDVDEKGTVLAGPGVVRISPNRVVGLTVDMRPVATPTFFVLEANRTVPNRAALVRIEPSGQILPIVPFAPIEGWPTRADQTGEHPLSARELAFEVGMDGMPLIAIIDELGRLFGGSLLAPIGLYRDRGEGPGRCPHIAALKEQGTITCFTDDGSLYRRGGH